MKFTDNIKFVEFKDDGSIKSIIGTCKVKQLRDSEEKPDWYYSLNGCQVAVSMLSHEVKLLKQRVLDLERGKDLC